jgi:hypothetical protein
MHFVHRFRLEAHQLLVRGLYRTILLTCKTRVEPHWLLARLYWLWLLRLLKACDISRLNVISSIKYFRTLQIVEEEIVEEGNGLQIEAGAATSVLNINSQKSV